MTPPRPGPPDDDRADGISFPMEFSGGSFDYSESAGYSAAADPPDLPAVVRVTSATASSGKYPAKLEVPSDGNPPTYSDDIDCWAVDPAGGTLSAQRYPAFPLLTHSDGLPVYAVGASGATGPSGSGTITVKESNEGHSAGIGVTTFSGVGVLQFDLGEVIDNGGTPKDVRLSYCGRQLMFDTAVPAFGDPPFSCTSAAWTAPDEVIFPTGGVGGMSALRASSPEFTGSAGATTDSRLEMPRDGVYMLRGAVSWGPNNTGWRYAGIHYVTTGTVVPGLFDQRQAVQGDWTRQCVSGAFFLGGGTDIFLAVAQSSGGALDVEAAVLEAFKIG